MPTKRILTQQDIDDNKELSGFKPGDEIEIPDKNEANTDSFNADGDGDDTGGSNPPPNKERP